MTAAILQSTRPMAVPVPSRALLRFLRDQAEACVHFTSRESCAARTRFPRAGSAAALKEMVNGNNEAGIKQKEKRGVLQRSAGKEGWNEQQAGPAWPMANTVTFGIEEGGHTRMKTVQEIPARTMALRAILPRPATTPTTRPSLALSNSSPVHVTTRHYTKEARSWLTRLAQLTRSHKSTDLTRLNGLHPDDLPGPPLALNDPTGAIFGRSKSAAEQTLRCTEFDENGKVVLVNGEFKKSELIAKYGLLPRDLRKIDSSLLPSIIVRPSCILINLLHLRILIQHNRVLIFDAWGSSNTYAQSMFMYDLEGKLGSKEVSRGAAPLPYEFRALEAVLISVTSGLEGEYEGIREPVSRVLRELEEDIDRDKLRYLLIYSKKLGTFEQKARLVRDAIDALLEEDEDLSAMYLTEKVQGVQRNVTDHTEIEMLLESYHKLADEIVQNSSNLVTNIRNTEEIIRAILDANRNALMLLDLKFSIGTLGIGSGAFVAALYGMNLRNFMEESDLGFLGISGVSAAFVGLVCFYGISKLRRVQRLRMWGERGVGSRGSWLDLGSTAGLPGENRAERMKRLKEERMAAWNMRKEWADHAMKEHKVLRYGGRG